TRDRILIDFRIASLLRDEHQPREVVDLIEAGVGRKRRHLQQKARGRSDCQQHNQSKIARCHRRFSFAVYRSSRFSTTSICASRLERRWHSSAAAARAKRPPFARSTLSRRPPPPTP